MLRPITLPSSALRAAERNSAVALMGVGQRGTVALLQRQPTPDALKRLDPSLLIAPQHHHMARRVGMEAAYRL